MAFKCYVVVVIVDVVTVVRRRLPRSFTTNGVVNTCCSLFTFCSPKPGHMASWSLVACVIPLMDPNVDNKVMTSVLFTDLICVKVSVALAL